MFVKHFVEYKGAFYINKIYSEASGCIDCEAKGRIIKIKIYSISI